MKFSKFLSAALAVLVLFSLTGCGFLAGIGLAEERIDNQVESIEDSLEAERPIPQDPNLPMAAVTAEQAQAIALEHAGFTAEQVSQLRVEYEIDDGIPQYDVEFREGRWEYSYEIHAETGAILSYEKDD